MEISNSELDLQDRVRSIKFHVHCINTLHEWDNSEDLIKQLRGHAISKMSHEVGFSISERLISFNENELGVSCLTPTEFSFISFDSEDLMDDRVVKLYPNDVIVFPSYLSFSIDSDNYHLYTFAVDKPEIFGHGSNKYRVSLTFKDEYELFVMADNEEEARALAMDIDMSYWYHLWNNDPELDKYQRIRYTRWGKKMLSAEIDK